MSDLRNPGDAWVTASDGVRYWGKFGAAGLLAHDRDRGAILLQHRVAWSDHGGTWGIPGGARHEGESFIAGAIREAQEEAGVPDNSVTPRFTHVLDRGGWKYTTVIADVHAAFEPEITDPESVALEWVPLDAVAEHDLHPAFAGSWPHLHRLLTGTPTVIVDAANVVGSVPDGWWKDRHGAAVRLRDRIESFAQAGKGLRSGFVGLPETVSPGLDRVFPHWVFVTEGQARGIESTESVSVVSAAELGNDQIVAEAAAAAAGGGPVAVVTSDEELKQRCLAVGAHTTRGARKLLKQLDRAGA